MDIAKVYADIFTQHGLFAGLLIVLVGCVLVGFGWMLYTVYPTQKAMVRQQAQMTISLADIAKTLACLHSLYSGHNQNALDMHITCRGHSDQFTDVYNRLGVVDGSLGKVSKELALLNQAITQMNTSLGQMNQTLMQR